MHFTLKNTTRNLIVLCFLIIAIITSIILVLSFQFEQSTTELRKDELKRLVSLGLSSIDEYRFLYSNGKISKEAAMQSITNQIRKLTYEDRIQQNYLFMSSYDGTMLVQPYQKDMEGTNQIDLADLNGKFIIRELISQAKKEPGYVSYTYFPPGSDQAYPKISYVVGLPEFECYIGTGIYSTDIAQIKRYYFSRTITFFIISFLILLSGAAVVVTPLIRAVQYIASCFSGIGNNNHLDELQVETSKFRKGSDAEYVVKRFAEITRNLSEKNRDLLKTSEERDRIRIDNIRLMENSLTEKELLIKEMNHRVKNNLQIIISLLNLQKEKSENTELQESYNDSISRMKSISIIHQMLYQSDDLSKISGKTYIEQMIHYLIHSFGVDKEINLELDIKDITFSIEQAVNIGLLTNEIITNSIKYAVPNNPDCSISISLKESDKIHTMRLSDNGPGIPEELLNGKVPGLGLKLIRSLSAQLGGDLKITNQGGTSYFLTF